MSWLRPKNGSVSFFALSTVVLFPTGRQDLHHLRVRQRARHHPSGSGRAVPGAHRSRVSHGKGVGVSPGGSLGLEGRQHCPRGFSCGSVFPWGFGRAPRGYTVVLVVSPCPRPLARQIIAKERGKHSFDVRFVMLELYQDSLLDLQASQRGGNNNLGADPPFSCPGRAASRWLT